MSPVRAGLARNWMVVACGIFASLSFSARGAPPGPLDAAEIYRRFSGAVAKVAIISEGSDGTTVPQRIDGTGFFIDDQGRILTRVGRDMNVARAWIEKDGLNFQAELIGTDRRTELGLFQVTQMPVGFGYIPLQPPAEPLSPGTPVVALTRPEGLKVSPNLGMLTAHESAYSRDTIFPCTYSRTNILFGPGEHGGPVLSPSGGLAGIAVVNVPNLRASYLVPTNALARVVSDMEANGGRVTYGTLRLEFSEEPDPNNVELQVKISKIEPDSPAERAQLRRGDVVRRLDDKPIRSLDDVRDILFFAKPIENRFMTLLVEREGKLQQLFTLPFEPLPQVVPKSEPPTSSQSGPSPASGNG